MKNNWGHFGRKRTQHQPPGRKCNRRNIWEYTSMAGGSCFGDGHLTAGLQFLHFRTSAMPFPAHFPFSDAWIEARTIIFLFTVSHSAEHASSVVTSHDVPGTHHLTTKTDPR